jgi:hypothetical protein
LDKIVARIDEVPSFDNADVKKEKKMLSKLVVDMMETTDRFLFEYGSNAS